MHLSCDILTSNIVAAQLFTTKGGYNMTDSEKLDLILSEIQGMKSEMQGMKSEMQGIKAEVQELKQRTANIENKVTNIDLTLENEIRVNIQRVAEGHLDLSRNLHEALRIDNEKEMLSIRVNVLETELRRIKERIESIA